MTIKGLWLEVKKHKNVIKEVPISVFSGYRIAIDMGHLMVLTWLNIKTISVLKCKNIAEGLDYEEMKIMWFRKILSEFVLFLENGITPIAVFDGEAPIEKAKTKESRKDIYLNQHEEIKNLRIALKKQSVLRQDQDMINRLRELERQTIDTPKETREELFYMLRDIGIPCIKPYDGIESERLASRLVIEGIAAGVYSPDGDCLAHGSPLLIRSDGKNKYDNKVTIIILDELLKNIKLNQKSFLDVCIMAGCDYNQNIPGIAFGKALKLIQEHKRFNKLPKDFIKKNKQHIEALSYDKCYNLFKQLSSDDMFDIDKHLFERNLTENQVNHLFNFVIDTKTFDYQLENYKISNFSAKLINLEKMTPNPIMVEDREFWNRSQTNNVKSLIFKEKNLKNISEKINDEIQKNGNKNIKVK